MAKGSFTPNPSATNNVQSQPDQPTISAAALKLVFDQFGIDDVDWQNNTLLSELNASAGSNKIGHTSASITADNVQEALEENRVDLDTLEADVTTLDGEVVKLTGNQSIAGVKTFSSLPVIPETPSTSSQAASKAYVDSQTPGFDVGNRSYLINGAFDVWQRGTTFTPLANVTYTADRWSMRSITSGFTIDIFRDTPIEDGFTYSCRIEENTAADTGVFDFYQVIENKEILEGKEATLTVKLKGDSGVTGTVFIIVDGSGGSGATFTCDGTVQTITVTRTVPTGTTLEARVRLNRSTMGLNQGVNLQTAKMELGDTATPYVPKTFAEELIDCQRYYSKSYEYATAIGTATLTSAEYAQFVATPVLSGNRIRYNLKYPQEMRAAPTLTHYDSAGNAGKISTISTDTVTTNVTPGTALFVNQTYKDVRVTIADGPSIFHWTADAEL